MNTYATPYWGYKVLSEGIVNVYYKFSLPITFDEIKTINTHITHTFTKGDGSINIYYDTDNETAQLLEQLKVFFGNKTLELASVAKFRYTINPQVLARLRPFSLTLEGSTAILLTHDREIKKIIGESWEYINQPCGGLFLQPYVLLLQKYYPRIIHPITTDNISERTLIEKKTSLFVKTLIKRFEETQPGYESLAFMSYLQEKTKLSQEVIASIMNTKLENSPRTYDTSLFMYF